MGAVARCYKGGPKQLGMANATDGRDYRCRRWGRTMGTWRYWPLQQLSEVPSIWRMQLGDLLCRISHLGLASSLGSRTKRDLASGPISESREACQASGPDQENSDFLSEIDERSDPPPSCML